MNIRDAKNRRARILGLAISLTAMLAVAAGDRTDWSLYGVGNATATTPSGEVIQVTDSGRDGGAVLTPDGSRAFFVRLTRDPAKNPGGIPVNDIAITWEPWSPFDIWVKDMETGEEQEFLRSAYPIELGADDFGRSSRGWFSDLQVSPNGEYLYYFCSVMCPTTWAVRRVNVDGTDDRWLTYALSMEVINEPGNQYHGCLRVLRRGIATYNDDVSRIAHFTVILNPSGTMRKFIKADPP